MGDWDGQGVRLAPWRWAHAIDFGFMQSLLSTLP